MSFYVRFFFLKNTYMNIGLHTDRQTEKNLVFYLSPFTILLSPFLSIVCPELWCLFTYSLFVFVTNMSAMSVVLVSLWLFFSFSLSLTFLAFCPLRLFFCHWFPPLSFLHFCLYSFSGCCCLSRFYFHFVTVFLFSCSLFLRNLYLWLSYVSLVRFSISFFFCIILFLFAVFSFSFLYPLTSLRFPSNNIFFFP